MILSVAMMLDWLAVRYDDPTLADGARAIESALQRAFTEAGIRPPDFGGKSTTADVVSAVVERL
jgi:3-isopropylmalate dehydrogenase